MMQIQQCQSGEEELVVHCAERGRQVKKDEQDEPLATWRDTVNISRTVSTKCVALKPD